MADKFVNFTSNCQVEHKTHEDGDKEQGMSTLVVERQTVRYPLRVDVYGADGIHYIYILKDGDKLLIDTTKKYDLSLDPVPGYGPDTSV